MTRQICQLYQRTKSALVRHLQEQMPAIPVSQLHEIISIARTLPWNSDGHSRQSQMGIPGSSNVSTGGSR